MYLQISTSRHHNSREGSLGSGKDHEHSDQGLVAPTYGTNEWQNHEQERMHQEQWEQRGSRQETGWSGQRWRTQREMEIPSQSAAEERDERNYHTRKSTTRYNGQRRNGVRRNQTTIILNSRLQRQQLQDREGAGRKPWPERQQLMQETSQRIGADYEQTQRNQPRSGNQRQERWGSFQMMKGKRRGERNQRYANDHRDNGTEDVGREIQL